MTLAMILSGLTGPVTSWKESLKWVMRDAVVVGAGLEAGGGGAGVSVAGAAVTAGGLSSLSQPSRRDAPRTRTAVMIRVSFTVFILSDELVGGIGAAQGIAFLRSGVCPDTSGGGF